MEGTCGITHWDETNYDRGGRWYDYFRDRMTKEAAAACQGAMDAGAAEIRVKDAHDSARNIIPSGLPPRVSMHRGWSGDYLFMVTGLAEGFDALAFTGYHAPACDGGNPLSHTIVSATDEIVINGERASEFLIHTYAAALYKIPVIFVSGDEALCRIAREKVPGITAVPVNSGQGAGVVSLHPAEAERRIKEGMKKAVRDFLASREDSGVLTLPPAFETTVRYKEHPRAYRAGQYPGAEMADGKTVRFNAKDYREVLRFLLFVT